ncbi:MAG: hypothetical protein ACYDBB_09265 [Armatimonadota bacterium]
MLAVFTLALRPLRNIPAHEYAQAVRAPAWFTVLIGSGIFLLSAFILVGLLSSDEQQFFVNWPLRDPWMMVDAYTLWGSALLGAVLAVSAWVPAARRSLGERSALPNLLMLVLAWLALVMLNGLRFNVILIAWWLLLLGTVGFGGVLFRHDWRRRYLDLLSILALAAVLGSIGLLWLNALAHGEWVTGMWSSLLSAPPKATNGATLLLLLGWCGPAMFIPWWLWARREEEAMTWLPAALMLSVVGMLTPVRLLFFAYPGGVGGLVRLPGLEHLFLVRNLLNWLTAWGVLAILVGAGWLAYDTIRRRQVNLESLRPLSLVAGGLLLVGMGAGFLAQQFAGVAGLLWMQVMWAGVITIWLAGGGLLSALTSNERGERMTVQIALYLALATLVAVPFTPGYWGMANLWRQLQQSGLPRGLLIVALVITAICGAWLLPRWAQHQQSPVPRQGSGWGILGPFAFAFAVIALGLFAPYLAPLFTVIHKSLLQAY